LWRRVFGMPPKKTWHDRHPLPGGWRPRVKVDTVGREVEPWGFMIYDRVGGGDWDAGERWLPVGRAPDEAAYEILDMWLVREGRHLPVYERVVLACTARRYGHDGGRVGIAYGADQAINA
jgi:hypothetical protein